MIKKGFMFLAVFFLLGVGTALADDLDIVGDDFAVSTQDVVDAGGPIVAGLAGLWGFRKVVKSINRS